MGRHALPNRHGYRASHRTPAAVFVATVVVITCASAAAVAAASAGSTSGSSAKAGSAANLAIGYVGRGDYRPFGIKVRGTTASTLFAETSVLPAGHYLASAAGDISVDGDGAIACFVSIVGHVHNDGNNDFPHDTDNPVELNAAIAIDDVFTSVSAGQRLGVYCSNGGATPDSDDFSDVFYVEINAVPVSGIHTTTIHKK
jgi:hypothetical protein